MAQIADPQPVAHGNASLVDPVCPSARDPHTTVFHANTSVFHASMLGRNTRRSNPYSESTGSMAITRFERAVEEADSRPLSIWPAGGE